MDNSQEQPTTQQPEAEQQPTQDAPEYPVIWTPDGLQYYIPTPGQVTQPNLL